MVVLEMYKFSKMVSEVYDLRADMSMG
jgi:hypothetical protein